MSPAPASPSTSDPILAATTVEGFISAVDTVYDLELPTGFPVGTVLAELWALAITVTAPEHPPPRYLATAAAPYRLGRPLAGTVVVAVQVASGTTDQPSAPDHPPAR